MSSIESQGLDDGGSLVPVSPGAVDGSSGNEETHEYPIRQVPTLLYEDLSRHLTDGEEVELLVRNQRYKMRRLKPDHPATGFPGAIGIHQGHTLTKFALWSLVPRGTDSVFEPEPIFAIDAGPMTSGLWALGRGRFIEENARAKLAQYGLPLKGEPARLVGLILYRAHQLARNPGCIKDYYWENERPDLDLRGI